MSVESARKFIEKFSSDPQFSSQITKASTESQKQQIVKKAGFDFTKEDLKQVNQEELEKLGPDVALPQSSGTWVGVGIGAAAAVTGTAAGVTGAVAAGASAASAAV